ncbi:MAG: hypothetical protein RL302_2121, partial [Pseudomonadota bacterium]
MINEHSFKIVPLVEMTAPVWHLSSELDKVDVIR